VRIVFGDRDPYLNRGVARRFHTLFPASDLFLVAGARHYVQVDEPQQVPTTSSHERCSAVRGREDARLPS